MAETPIPLPTCCCRLIVTAFSNGSLSPSTNYVIYNYTDCQGIQQSITLTNEAGAIQYTTICTSDSFNDILNKKSVGTFINNGIQADVAVTNEEWYTILESCTNPSEVIYVYLDIPGTNFYFELNEIPGCWHYYSATTCVPINQSFIPYNPLTNPTIKNSYASCPSCLNANLQYYRLTSCNSPITTIITQTDLSAYVNKVIKIDGDTNCYSITTIEFGNNPVSVTVTDEYNNCPECLPPPPPPAYYLNSCTNDTTNNKIIVYNGPNPNALPNPSTLGSATLGVFTYESISGNITLPGCFNIIPAPAGVYPTAILYTDVVSFTQFTSCPQCNAPTFKLTLCDETIELTPWITNTDLLVYDGTTQKIEITTPGQHWPVGTYCVTITRIVTEVGVPFTGVISPNFYQNCFECLRVCYLITPCLPSTLEPRVVYNDFSQYVGKIVKIEGCPDVCWEVSISETCEFGVNVGEVTDSYDTCQECAPVIPVPTFSLHPRRIKPGYFSKNSCLTTDYIEKVNCTFAQEVYNKMIVIRYGITPCCGDDLDKWDIKKQILDFELLTDPDLCKSTLCNDEPPC